MKISVALCTYNGGKYLQKQIESILNQSISINEIVITDDRSTDNTIDIINSFKKQYSGKIIAEINEHSLGAKKNFEKAISKCAGDVIFLSDHDDIWFPNKVEMVLEKFKEEPLLEVIFTDAVLIDDNDIVIDGTLFQYYNFSIPVQVEWQKDKAVEELLSGMNRITGATMAIKKELLLRCLPFTLPGLVWHDAWLGLHAALFNRLGWINEPLIKYRVHAGQQVGIGNGTTVKDFNRKRDLRELLADIRNHEIDWLQLTNLVLETNKRKQVKKIRKRKINTLRLIDHRLNLPRNLFKRSLLILKKSDLYFNTLGKPFRSIIRDIVRPA